VETAVLSALAGRAGLMQYVLERGDDVLMTDFETWAKKVGELSEWIWGESPIA